MRDNENRGCTMAKVEPHKLPWDYWVYQTLAVIMLIPTGIISALYLITYPTIEAWALVGLIISTNVGFSLIIIVICAKLKAGSDFSVVRYLNAFASSTSSPLTIHRYIVATIVFLIGISITMVSGLFFYTPFVNPINHIGTFTIGISIIYTLIGHFTKSPPPKETP